ncbi:MAG TPA: prepilin-type N-terminal cleavage/methylation domain-containing protein [Phycisphaerae bacterium]|nr:prepilin-type N-terminal cleavage/methylation domain-containing protein [Phycisphaerae bacterium]
MSPRRTGFTLIELLVVVAIIALLISILLPSLNKAREQAKAGVCASRLRSFGQASAVYESEYNSFAPSDPYHYMPMNPKGNPQPGRGLTSVTHNYDPVHGWLAHYSMRIRPEIPSMFPASQGWRSYPHGFRLQAEWAPDTLWEGFFCPTQIRHNTMDFDSPELAGSTGSIEPRPVLWKYASGYMTNRNLRSATSKGGREGIRWPARPNPSFQATFSIDGPDDNIWGASEEEGVQIDIGDGSGDTYWQTQAVTMSEVRDPGETMSMADSVDYHLSPRTGSLPYTGTGWSANREVSAGMWTAPFTVNSDRKHNVLGARHLTKANVLYADSHVDNDNQIPRDKRGSLVIASTFADYMDDYEMGTQHHMAPFGRHP